MDLKKGLKYQIILLLDQLTHWGKNKLSSIEKKLDVMLEAYIDE